MVLYLHYPIIVPAIDAAHYISCGICRSLHIGHKIILFWNQSHVIDMNAKIYCLRSMFAQTLLHTATNWVPHLRESYYRR